MASKILLNTILSTFQGATKKPENFQRVQNDVADSLKVTTKVLYDFIQSVDDAAGAVLPELIVDQFDDEQVWQELELHNTPSIDQLLKAVAKVAAVKHVTFAPKQLTKPAAQQSHEKRKKKKKVAPALGKASVATDVIPGARDVDAAEEGKEMKGFAFDDEDEDEDDLSEEELEMKRLLDKVTAAEKQEDSEEEGGGLRQWKDEAADSEDEEESADSETDAGETLRKALAADKKTKKNSQLVSGSDSQRQTVVDDRFFQLSHMEEFLDQEDAKEEKRRRKEEGKQDEGEEEEESDEDEIDLFQNLSSDEEEEAVKYADFFDPVDDDSGTVTKSKAKQSDDDEDESGSDEEEEAGSEEEEEEEDAAVAGLRAAAAGSSDSEEGEDVADILGAERGKKSGFQLRQQKMREHVDEMEAAALEAKAWQLKGEVGAGARPKNSLMEEALDHEHNSRLAPVITEETTQKLEDIIMQRIKDKAWDDVERKKRKQEGAGEYKRRLVLDQEKSKLSLGEVYEQEFLKQQQEEEVEKVDPQREEVQKQMQALFVQLDALSNFHYTPKPSAPEVRIVSNQPSILMEEVAPVSVSEAAQLAPEEIQEKKAGELTGDTERSDTDKKRARRKKRKMQADKFAAREKKMRKKEKTSEGVKDKTSKDEALKDLKKQSKKGKEVKVIEGAGKPGKSGLTSSTQFFSQLQDEVKSHISSRKAARKKAAGKPKSAAQFKL